jgi:hypothetical protein
MSRNRPGRKRTFLPALAAGLLIGLSGCGEEEPDVPGNTPLQAVKAALGDGPVAPGAAPVRSVVDARREGDWMMVIFGDTELPGQVLGRAILMLTEEDGDRYWRLAEGKVYVVSSRVARPARELAGSEAVRSRLSEVPEATHAAWREAWEAYVAQRGFAVAKGG